MNIEAIAERARRAYVADYQRIVTGPFGVIAPYFPDYLEREYDRAFLESFHISTE